MPRNLTALLSTLCGVAFAGYLALMFATVFFASMENTLSVEARETEARITALEAEYYDAIGHLSGVDLGSAGFSDPVHVTYVSLDGAPAVTRADR